MGSNGIRGCKWRLDSNGGGAIAGGNISWDTTGKVTFSPSVSLHWTNAIDEAKKVNFGYPYYKKIIVYGDSKTYYPVVIKGGEQTVKRDILIRRALSEQAPYDWNTPTHKGSLIALLKTNFGSWGGVLYSWDIYELSECYCRMFAGAAHCANYCMFAVFLRGGGTTGAVYHLYSDQPLESLQYSSPPVSQESPQICYDSDLIFSHDTSYSYAPLHVP